AYELFIPADASLLHVDFLDPRTRQSATVFPFEAPERQFTLPALRLVDPDPQAADADHDGLSDFAEEILGTHRTEADTDGDGVPDGIELDQGANPLDGIAVQTGVVAAVDTPGRAVDIAIAGDLAAIADGETGIALFQISNPSRPVLLSRVDTAGDARRVAISARHVAVADGSGGLALIDVAGEMPWRVRQQVPLGSHARTVAASGPTAYVGLDSRDVVVLDLFTASQLDRIRIPGSGDLQDLLVGDGVLYVLTSSELFTLPLDEAPLRIESRLPAPGLLPGGLRPRRLTHADGRLYAGHRRGFVPYDLADPRHPAPQPDVVTSQFGWKHWLPIAPGLAIAAVGPDSTPANNHDVQLYAIDSGSETPTFLTTLATPGIAQAVAFSKGLAFVADDLSGLQVLNVVSAQVGGPPPTVTLEEALSDIAGGITEGQVFRISARASSSQGLVRLVEYHLDGEVVARAGHHPFRAEILAPLRTGGKTTVRLRARAVDSAGGSGWSEERTVSLLADTAAPEVAFEVPSPGRTFAPLPGLVVGVTFRDRMDARTFTSESFRLYAVGSVGLPTESVIPATVGYREDTLTAWLATPQPLAPGTYRLALETSVADPGGNRLAAPRTWQFQVISQDLRNGGSLVQAGAIDRPGVQDRLVFQARAGQSLYFDEVSGNCNSGL
ncbi:MAG: Ig-like domain-containing protein, partial [Nitrospira sp.]|nr:Ig-like domain-containing protein [Nitrospira sp.]